MKKFIKALSISILIIISMGIGVYSGYYKNSIYYAFRDVKDLVYKKPLQGRYTLTSKRIPVSNDQLKKIPRNDLFVFMTYGQSHTLNSTRAERMINENVINFFNGKNYIYDDPSLGASGSTSSIWGLVGDKLINKTKCSKVVFAHGGYGGRTIEKLCKKSNFDYFAQNYIDLKNFYGHVDAILFHQGASNNTNRNRHDEYEKYFHKLISKIDSMDTSARLIMAKSSYNTNFNREQPSIDTALTLKQNKIIKRYTNVFLGPNADSLIDKEHRISQDDIHFSKLGAEKLSTIWTERIIRFFNKNK